MDIKKAFKQAGCKYLIGFIDDTNCVKVDFWDHSLGIQTNTSTINLYAEDTEDYREVSKESFCRMLRVVRHRLDKSISDII